MLMMRRALEFRKASGPIHGQEADSATRLPSTRTQEINDFLDMAISYAVVVCFGVIAPFMATVAVVSILLSLRPQCLTAQWRNNRGLFLKLAIPHRPPSISSMLSRPWQCLDAHLLIFLLESSIALEGFGSTACST